MTTFHAKAASSEKFVLGEGPLWDAPRNRVFWVDIDRGDVCEGYLAGDAVEVSKRHSFEGTVSAVVVAEDGRLLVAGQTELTVISLSGERTKWHRIVPQGTQSRINDGAVDPQGRFLIGTLALDERAGEERLLRVETDGRLTCIDSDLGCSNGLAWSRDGSRFYSIDTLPGIIWVRDYDSVTGEIGARRELLRIVDGLPDGLCIDTNDNLWIAIWGAGEVRSYSSAGKHLDTVKVSARCTSSVAFVGADLDLLLITTAQAPLTNGQPEVFPDSGRIFTARVNAVGIPTTPWSPAWVTRESSRQNLPTYP
jgi:sugar lactone lactonase YvrE